MARKLHIGLNLVAEKKPLWTKAGRSEKSNTADGSQWYISSDRVSIDNRIVLLDEACLIGISHYQNKELSKAEEVFRRVIAAEPGHPRALNALAIIDSEKGNYDQAQVWLDTLLTAHPGFEKGYNTRGMLMLKQKKVEDAEKDFLKAISLNQDFAEAYGNLGDLYLLQRRFDAAADCFTRVVNLNPAIPQAYCSLGNALTMLGLHEDAAANFNRALDLAPDFAPAHLGTGDLLRILGRYTEAVTAYENALKLSPADGLYHRSLGNAYRDIGNLSRTLELLLEAQRLNPADPITELSLGNIYWEMEYLHEAALAYQRGLALATLSTDGCLLRSGLGSVYISLGHSDEAMAEFRVGLEMCPDNELIRSNLLLAMHYSAEVTKEEIFRESVAWGCNQPPESFSPSMRDVNVPLRIGFVSADFRVHSVSYFFEPLLAALDRKRFKVYCYSGVRNCDTTTDRLKSLADSWVDCFSISDELLVEAIRAEKVDVLVDLSGHTGGNRLGTFAKRAAPIQITWLGYPDTTGLRAMDYRITDAIADPVGVADQLHTEKLIRMADCFLCYLPPHEAAQISYPPDIDNKFITFGSFNNLAKVTPQVLEVWAGILNAVPASRLVLKCRAFVNDDNRNHWRNILQALGFGPDRFCLLSFEIDKSNHFARYDEIDIALDTFPYNGTTTTCEALWMGVPVITLAGDRHSSRVGASLLSCIGLNELVANSHEEYIDKAVKLAADEVRLSSYRQTMRSRILSSPLCDAAGFARRWEEAVLKIVSEHNSH